MILFAPMPPSPFRAARAGADARAVVRPPRRTCRVAPAPCGRAPGMRMPCLAASIDEGAS